MVRNLIIAKILGYKLVFSLHDLTPTYELQPRWVDTLGHWVIIHLVDRVIVHCQQARLLLREMYKRRRNIFVVNHPSYETRYENRVTKLAAREKLGLENNHKVFTFFGGIRPNKGLENLIMAFRKMEEPALRLIIAGKPFPPPSYIKDLKLLAGGDERIIFILKYIPDQEVQVYLNAADIVVLPFTRILTSGSAMLALSFGKPVIAPRMGCIPELVDGSAGWLYQPEDPNGLLNAMKQALGDNIEAKGRHAKGIVEKYRNVNMAQEMYNGFLDR